MADITKATVKAYIKEYRAEIASFKLAQKEDAKRIKDSWKDRMAHAAKVNLPYLEYEMKMDIEQSSYPFFDSIRDMACKIEALEALLKED